MKNKMLECAMVHLTNHILCFDNDKFLDENCLIEHVNFYNSEEKVYINAGSTYN